MPSVLNPEKLVDYLKPIISSCALWSKKKLSVLVIANPTAGGFTIMKPSIKNESLLKMFASDAKTKKPCIEVIDIVLHKTTCAGDANTTATTFVDNILNKDTANNGANEYLIITAGGDGTSLEVQTALVIAALASAKAFSLITKKITVLRLPLGTGNDGTDGRTLDVALCRLTLPSKFVLRATVKVQCKDKDNSRTIEKKQRKKIVEYGSLSDCSPWYAFNIASVGIDAFITYMTNKTKGIFNGNFYKLWTDLACLFYDFQFPSKPVNIEVFDKDDTSVLHVNEPISFCLLGVSGHRTYGSGQKILPDNRSVCIARKMSILTKLIMKKKFSTGKHSTSNKAIFAEGEKIVINYNQYLLTQMDGEVHLLCPEDFPVIIERTLPVIRVIENSNIEN